MINGQDLGRLIELAFDYVSAESEQQAAQFRDEAARLATIETTTLINGQDLGQLIELAFNYVSAESKQHAAQFRDRMLRIRTQRIRQSDGTHYLAVHRYPHFVDTDLPRRPID